MSEPRLSDLDEIAQTDARGAWLLTYADLVTLILVFFILLFALSNMELGNITDTLKSLEISIGAEEPKTSLFDIIKTGSPGGRKMLDQLIGMREVDVFKEIESFISRRGLSDNVEAELREGRIVLRYLIEDGVFQERLTATGFADLRPVAGNDTPEGRSKNRRVEFVLKEKQ